MKTFRLPFLALLFAALTHAAGAAPGYLGAQPAAGPAINAQSGTSYTVTTADAGKFLTFNNASAVAVGLPQATGFFGISFFVEVQNLGAGTVTITPTTSTIGGASSLVLATGQGAKIVSDGSNYQVRYDALGSAAFKSVGTSANNVVQLDGSAKLPAIDGSQLTNLVGAGADYQAFTANGTWTKPVWATNNNLVIVELIGAGGGGQFNSTTNGASGGGGGGEGDFLFRASDLGATVAVTVGTGGAAGATSGANSSNGGLSSFGGVVYAFGGSGGSGTSTTGVGGSGGTMSSDYSNVSGAGANASGATAAGSGVLTGGGGGTSSSGLVNAGGSVRGGGGGGGWVSSSAGTAGTSTYAGAGGAASTTTAGGAGSIPGGGGGAGKTAGGVGARGEVRVWTLR